MGLEALFHPRSIVVVGASEKPTIGRRLIASLTRIGFCAGRYFPVNPNYPDRARGRQMLRQHRRIAGGARCRGLLRRPRARPRAACRSGGERVGSRPPSSTTAASPSAARKGAGGRRKSKGFLVATAVSRSAGRTAWECWSPHHRSSTYLQELRDPAGLAGNVGISTAERRDSAIGLLNDVRRFGFSHVVSSGNEAGNGRRPIISSYLVDDPHTKVIGGFIETVRLPGSLCCGARSRRSARGSRWWC